MIIATGWGTSRKLEVLEECKMWLKENSRNFLPHYDRHGVDGQIKNYHSCK
jgi:hypothetical protein